MKQPEFVPAILPSFVRGCTPETHFQCVLDGCKNAPRGSYRQTTHLYLQDEGIIPKPGPEHIITSFGWLKPAFDLNQSIGSETPMTVDQASQILRLTDMRETFDHLVSMNYSMARKVRLPLLANLPFLGIDFQYIPDTQLCFFLTYLPRLKILRLSINNALPSRFSALVMRNGLPYIDDFWSNLDCLVPETLEIGGFGLLIIPEPLAEVVLNHVDTLKFLVLDGVRLPDLDDWVWFANALEDCALERIEIERPMILGRILDIGVGVGKVERVVIEGNRQVVKTGLARFGLDLH